MVLLELAGISKAFFGVPALHDVSLGVREGGVLGLIGQNGAGKSTLMNIIGGVIQADSGTVTFAGEAYAPRSPAEASGRGIAFIHQELNLFTNLTVAENIFMGGFPQRRLGPLRLIDRTLMRQRTQALLAPLELKLSHDTLIDDLSPGERQLVEIARALHSDARLIIFDEPTTSLAARETERLFRIMRRLREAGKTMIYISHILSDVKELADDVAVLRDGELVGSGEVAEFNVARMISMMIGRDLGQLYPPRKGQPASEVVLEVKGVSQAGIVKDISFGVRRGEIVGIFGLMGSGRTELARILFGLDPFEEGELLMNGVPLQGSPQDSIRRGLAFVTENRREEGLMMEATIASNLALVALRDYARPPLGVVAANRLLAEARGVSAVLQVRSGDIGEQPVKSLSGGNQQKVVIGKWLMSGPKLFIMDEPTRGVDVGAKYEIYSIMGDLAAGGNSVLFISSELDELMGMCDRMLVMSRGEITGDFAKRDFNKSSVLHAAFGEEMAA